VVSGIGLETPVPCPYQWLIRQMGMNAILTGVQSYLHSEPEKVRELYLQKLGLAL
jgi:hypothetical protein